MMRLAAFATPLLLLCPGIAAAQTSTGTSIASTPDALNAERAVRFEGMAAPACVIRSISATQQRNASLVATSERAASVTLDADGFIDPQTGVPRASGISLLLPITCNSPHHVRIASTRGALLLAGASPETSRFRSRLDFDVSVGWAGQNQSFNTSSGTSIDLAIPNAATGDAAIRIDISGGGSPLVAGTYGDSLTILVETSS